jgi:pilus assembly protein CpaE
VTKVLLTSRNPSALRALQHCLAQQSEFDAHVRLINNGHTDPLYGLSFAPDVVVLRFDAEHLAELAAWSDKNAASRPPLIVVGPAGQAEAMRLAIRSGAKDFLPEPVTPGDLIAALRHVRAEMNKLSGVDSSGNVYAVVGAAGGAGTSFVAVNSARLLADDSQRIAAPAPMLVDLDLNFAPLAHYLDLHPERGLLQAIEAVDALDEFALTGFGAKHRSGLRLLCGAGGPAVLSKDVPAEGLSKLIGILAANHPHVILDVPHVLDNLTATVFSLSTHVVLVLQQSLLHVHNAARLLQILKTELGVPAERIRVVVNRYQKDALVELDDIRRSLNADTILTVPSHYRSALESIDTGVPLCEIERNSAVVRALRQLVSALTGEGSGPRGGLLQRVLPTFLRSKQ